MAVDLIHLTEELDHGGGTADIEASKRPEILVVDDDANYRWIACVRLESAGFRCHEASTHDEALAILVAEPSIKVVLLDHTMHGQGPAGPIALIRKERPDVRIIGHSSAERGEEFHAWGVEVFLLKPLRVEELRRIVAALN